MGFSASRRALRRRRATDGQPLPKVYKKGGRGGYLQLYKAAAAGV